MYPEFGFWIAPNRAYIRELARRHTVPTRIQSLSNFLTLVKFSYWSKFHVNIITGSGVMTTFVCKGLTRDAEIGNTPI